MAGKAYRLVACSYLSADSCARRSSNEESAGVVARRADSVVARCWLEVWLGVVAWRYDRRWDVEDALWVLSGNKHQANI